jgi:hypothetical protein
VERQGAGDFESECSRWKALIINKLTMRHWMMKVPSVHLQAIGALITRPPDQTDSQGRQVERLQTVQSCRIDEHGQLPGALQVYLLCRLI